jgi:hypothetical protein
VDPSSFQNDLFDIVSLAIILQLLEALLHQTLAPVSFVIIIEAFNIVSLALLVIIAE